MLQLQRSIRDFAPPPADFHSSGRRTAVPSSLATCLGVFVRVDAVKRPLTPPYVGPYEVLQRSDKTFVLLKAGKPWTVSVDRLKPFFPPDMSAPSSLPTSSSSPVSATPPAAPGSRTSPYSTSSPSSLSSSQPFSLSPSLRTRSGRLIKPPDRYNA